MTRGGVLLVVRAALVDVFDQVDLVDEHTVGVEVDGERFLLDVAVDGPGYEREDPVTGAPLPAGVDGFSVGGRS